MSRLRGRLTYANVVSTLALFVALTGGAIAAANEFVSPDGAIEGCVGKGGALSVARAGHLCPHGLKALLFNQTGARGPRGANGINGTNGTNGVNGADGTTHGYQAVANGPVDITSDVLGQSINLQTIGQLALPAGTFLITVKAGYKIVGTAGTSATVYFDCRLRDSVEGPRDFASVTGQVQAPNSQSQGDAYGTVSLAGDVGNSTAANEILECGDTNGAAGIDYNIYNVVIQAVQLKNLN